MIIYLLGPNLSVLIFSKENPKKKRWGKTEKTGEKTIEKIWGTNSEKSEQKHKIKHLGKHKNQENL